MTSLNNAIFATNTHTGIWEIVETYTSVKIITMGAAGKLTLEWANNQLGSTPGATDIISTEEITVTAEANEFTRNVICSRFRLKFDTTDTGNTETVYINVMYSEFFNHIKIIDDKNTATSVDAGSLSVVITGSDGTLIGTTLAQSNNALWTYLVDEEGKHVKQAGTGATAALSVTVADSNGQPIDISNSSLCVHLADANGYSVGATTSVKDSRVPGIANYTALPIASSIRDFSVGLVASLRSDTGLETGSVLNRLYMNVVGDVASYSSTFDVSQSLTNVSPVVVFNRSALVYGLQCYNTGAVTAWINIYDQSAAVFHPKVEQATLRIAIPAETSRDLYFHKACSFTNGLCAIATVSTTDYDIDVPQNTVFMSGTYMPYSDATTPYSPVVQGPTATPVRIDITPTGSNRVFAAGANIWNGTPLETIAMQLEYDVSSNTTIEIPARYAHGKLYIDWGDQTVDYIDINSDLYPHKYSTGGKYTVSIVGPFTQYGYNKTVAGIDNLIGIKGFGNAPIRSLDHAFARAYNLISVSAGILPPTVKILDHAFAGAIRFTGAGIQGWNMSNVTSAIGTFMECADFVADISSWTLTSLKTSDRMFRLASNFNSNIGGWSVPALVSGAEMFYGAVSFNRSLTNWNRPAYYDANIFTGSGMSTSSYSATLVAWKAFVEAKVANGYKVLGTIGAQNISAGATGTVGSNARLYLKGLGWRFDDATP